MARTCIFCGGSPVTLEHVWPKWLLGRFRTTGFLHTLARTGPRPVTFSKPSIEVTANCVCGPCNSGWMSRLEVQGQPWLEPLLEGRHVTLDSVAQRTISAWATKTAMVFEHTLSLPDDEVYWRQEERAVFRIHPHVPPGVPGDETNVRIATFTGSKLFLVHAGATTISPLDAPDVPVPATRATLQVGRLALQVESHRWREVTGRTLLRPGPAFGAFLWPERQEQLQWPVQPFLDDAQLEQFASFP